MGSDENKSLIYYDLLDHIDIEDEESVTSKLSSIELPEEILNPKHYNYLIQIPLMSLIDKDDNDYIKKIINYLTKQINYVFSSCLCVTEQSDIIFTTNIKEISEQHSMVFYNDRFSFTNQYGDCIDNLIANIGIKVLTNSPRGIIQILYKLYNSIISRINTTTDLMIINISKSVDGKWKDMKQQGMFYIDSSFINFVKSGGTEQQCIVAREYICTYGILYNILKLFYSDTKDIKHWYDTIMSYFQNYDVSDINYQIANIIEQTNRTKEIPISNEILSEILNNKILIKNVPDDVEVIGDDFKYTLEVFIQPLYRKYEKILNGGAHMVQWIENEPDNNIEEALLRDALMLNQYNGNEISIKKISLKLMYKNSKLWIYLFICPDTIIDENNHIIDCCICCKMNVVEYEYYTSDTIISKFISKVNDDIFQSQLDIVKLNEIIIENRLSMFR